MKTRFLALVAGLLLPLAARAQTPAAVPNGNLETWGLRNGVELPANWLTGDDVANVFGFPLLLIPRTVTKSADAYGGSFAARVQNAGNSILALPGILILGAISSQSSRGGVPYTSRPARLQFWYKLTGPSAAADMASVLLVLSNKSDSVATTRQVLAPRAAYTLVEMPLRYHSNQQPDTLRIAFASGIAPNASTTSVLFIDDVQLVGTVTSIRAGTTAPAALQVYPNPSASGEFSLASLTDVALATAPLTITDATGRQILRQGTAPASAAAGRLVDLRGQRGGVYLLRLETAAGPIVRKLVIQ
ncbi:hypothetical protein CDA63_10065 [Hymenobacter amundsenii]|uniref:Uncharacterized protein n=1 Tax=Hymenobacter amundsenii TaxID=2006685 RepID=A0A2D0AFL6_9BACT|nr:T9SS type A sorting domain-containing protein [Hymenobacter amundsenii]OWP63192.1 hypothetical protein CDA63_10065 [Hymenobacter amundsenii]